MRTRSFGIAALALALLAAGAAGIWGWRYWNSDERQVRRTLASLCDTFSKPAGESAAAGAFKLGRCSDLFAPVVQVDLHHPAFQDRMTAGDVASMAARIRPLFASLTVEFRDVELLRTGADEFEVFFTGIVRGRGKERRSDFSADREIRCRLHRSADRWRVTSVVGREILEK